MKIAYLAQGYPRTSHTFIRREIRALESLGVEVLRYSVRPLDEPLVTDADREEHGRTRVLLSAGVGAYALALALAVLGRPRAFAQTLGTALHLARRSDRGLLRHLAYVAEAAVLERWLRSAGVTHVHAHFGTNATGIALLCERLGGPRFSFTVHLDDFDNVQAKTAAAAFVVAISSFGRSQFYRRIDPRAWHKVREVHCGVDAPLLAAPSTPVPDAPRLVCVARLHADKGHLILLDAAARLAAEHVPFELIFAGDGPFRSAIEDHVRRLGLQGRVQVAGWMSEEEVRRAVVGARAVVLPSFREGLPVSLMEALALGRPVISTAIAGIPELVVPGVSGWIVPAGSVDALVPVLREALEAPPARLEAMGRAGAALVAERHDATKEARKLLALFRTAAGDVAGRLGRRAGEAPGVAAPEPEEAATPSRSAVR